MQRPYEHNSKLCICLIISGLYGQFLGASLSANKLKLSALRWAFFVQGRQEPRSCKALHGKSPKGRRPLSFNLFNAAPPRRRRGMWRTQCGKSRNRGHHKRGLRENIITRDLDRAASPHTSETLTHRPAAFSPHIKFLFFVNFFSGRHNHKCPPGH